MSSLGGRDFSLVVVTPSRQVFEGAVRSLQAPGTDGDFEVLVGHIPMLTSLRPGIVTVGDAEGRSSYSVGGGFVEVMRRRATVLAESIERVDDIDLDRARQAETRAQERLDSAGPSIDVARAKAALARAQNRIKAAGIPTR
ncbi:MAG: F0F1 ATP synthase subunit epsilon [Gemmatimonadota bacterium]|nr:F0F1 ATP synthase subunit epsilon [Gemmatimonadota bacterium]